jgi:hypothetical protein
VPEQKQYDDMLEQYKSKKRVVDALDMIARYKLANQT